MQPSDLNKQLQLIAYVFHYSDLRKRNRPLWRHSLSLLVTSLETSIHEFDSTCFMQMAITGQLRDSTTINQHLRSSFVEKKKMNDGVIVTMMHLAKENKKISGSSSG